MRKNGKENIIQAQTHTHALTMNNVANLLLTFGLLYASRLSHLSRYVSRYIVTKCKRSFRRPRMWKTFLNMVM